MNEPSITIKQNEFLALIKDICKPHIRCESKDCIFNFPLILPSSCVLADGIILREGICRNFRPGEKLRDRTDLPGGNYIEFIKSQMKKRETISSSETGPQAAPGDNI